MTLFEGFAMPTVIARCKVDGVPDVPVFPHGDAITLLREIRDEASLPSVAAHGVVMCASDVAALQWALEQLGAERRKE